MVHCGAKVHRTDTIKVFMISLIAMGVLLGTYASDVLRPAIWLVWIVFLLTATIFIIAARLRIKRSRARHELEQTQPIKDDRSRCS